MSKFIVHTIHTGNIIVHEQVKYSKMKPNAVVLYHEDGTDNMYHNTFYDVYEQVEGAPMVKVN